MTRRTGLTITELLVVLTILGLLVALLLPAIHAAREKARETTCKNNLHQMNVAVCGFAEVHKQLPTPPAPGIVGGWTIAILPFLEQKPLADSIVPGTTILNAAAALSLQPRIMRCPNRKDSAVRQQAMSSAHYVLVRINESFLLFDAPGRLNAPWASGPEMQYNDIMQEVGPHHGGLFFISGSQQGAGLVQNGHIVR